MNSSMYWQAQYVFAAARVETLELEIARLRATNRRLNRRCQQAEAVENEFRHAANLLRDVAGQVAESGSWAKHWLDRLRVQVRAAEASKGSEP